MINAEDLRIGDIVQTNKDSWFPKDTLCIVSVILPDRQYNGKKGAVFLKNVNDDNGDPWLFWCCNIDGIPVTPEILRNNDFKEDVEGKYFTRPIKARYGSSLARYLAVELKRENWVVFIKYRRLHDCVLLRKIQHVHELQHILWALGLNAELKV